MNLKIQEKQRPLNITTFKVKNNTALVSEKEIFVAIEEKGSCKNRAERLFKVRQDTTAGKCISKLKISVLP
jgi:hypothetical protein